MDTTRFISLVSRASQAWDKTQPVIAAGLSLIKQYAPIALRYLEGLFWLCAWHSFQAGRWTSWVLAKHLRVWHQSTRETAINSNSLVFLQGCATRLAFRVRISFPPLSIKDWVEGKLALLVWRLAQNS
jgi:hypothetical protein